MPPASDPIRVALADGVLRATIDFPPLNLLGADLFGALSQLIDRLERDDESQVVILQSADPDFFIAHGDVETIVTVPTEPTPEVTELPFTHQTLERWRSS